MKNKSDVFKMLVMQAKCRLRGENPKILRDNIKLIKNEDDELYKKVCTILSENDDVLNPIARLMDMNAYTKLDPAGKERYFFSLVNKYICLKERYNKERA